MNLRKRAKYTGPSTSKTMGVDQESSQGSASSQKTDKKDPDYQLPKSSQGSDQSRDQVNENVKSPKSKFESKTKGFSFSKWMNEGRSLGYFKIEF